MAHKSLTFRIIALSSIWIILALVATSLLLWYYYQDHIGKHYDAHVFMHLEEMVTASKLAPDGSFKLDFHPSDPRFQELNSGWYWETRVAGETLERSPSLGGNSLDLVEAHAAEDHRVQVISGPNQQDLRVQTLEISKGLRGEKILLLASAPNMRIEDDVIDIAEHMLVSFIVLGAGLILAVVFQIRLALKPLHAISREITNIHEGKSDRLQSVFPREVQPLVDELNNLLEHNAVLLKRARNQLGNLAHSIKNPLTVINNEAHALDDPQKERILDQAQDISKSVDHYLVKARASGADSILGTRANIRSVTEDLVFAMQRLYKDRNLEFDTSGLSNCSFRGEAQDLEEMLGNLMDNACKWARERVVVTCRPHQNRCLLIVEDDGPGIPEEQLEKVLERGQQLDESMHGHGLGLGIVQDLVELYDARLTLKASPLGGLAAELELPGA